jgi:hypothetical protein
MSTSLVLSYTVNPPPLPPTVEITTPKAQTFSYPLSSSSPTQHLQSLETALGLARDQLNQSLTEWKKAVHGIEVERKGKGKKSAGTSEVDEEDEAEDEEEE